MDNCIFCKIVKKEIPSDILYEDDEIMAFKDVNPMTPVHVLVIPKKHIPNLLEVTKEDERVIGKIHSVINKLAIESGIDKTGFRVVTNCGEDSGQEVKHLHFHILGGRKLGSKV